ncbi:hypothetical protein FKM82_017897 [Ascaphus truei]
MDLTDYEMLSSGQVDSSDNLSFYLVVIMEISFATLYLQNFTLKQTFLHGSDGKSLGSTQFTCEKHLEDPAEDVIMSQTQFHLCSNSCSWISLFNIHCPKHTSKHFESQRRLDQCNSCFD